MKYKVISFDFDHTLTRGATAAEHVSDFLGCADIVADAEDRFRTGLMTTRQFTDAVAHCFKDRPVDVVQAHMLSMPLVGDILSTVSWLKDKGLRVVINTVGFHDLMVPFATKFGFHDVSGVRLTQEGGRFTGGVDAYFPLEGKIQFAHAQAEKVDSQLSGVIAIGDGLSDVPLFQSVGRSIAFNAPLAVQSMTHGAATGVSCTALLPVFESFLMETAA